MLKALVILSLALAANALPTNTEVKDEVVRFGSAGVTYSTLNGALIPVAVPDAKFRTFLFRTEEELELKEDEFVTFRCMPLDDVYVTSEKSVKKTVLFCRGSLPVDENKSKTLVFLFAADGITFTPEAPEDKEINLKLGTKAISSLTSVSDTLLGTTVLGDRVKKQFGGGGFSGSGAQAGASSFGSGFGGGFPGGFGGGMSGSQAQAGASSFGSGGGFFG